MLTTAHSTNLLANALEIGLAQITIHTAVLPGSSRKNLNVGVKFSGGQKMKTCDTTSPCLTRNGKVGGPTAPPAKRQKTSSSSSSSAVAPVFSSTRCDNLVPVEVWKEHICARNILIQPNYQSCDVATRSLKNIGRM